MIQRDKNSAYIREILLRVKGYPWPIQFGEISLGSYYKGLAKFTLQFGAKYGKDTNN